MLAQFGKLFETKILHSVISFEREVVWTAFAIGLINFFGQRKVI